MGICDFCGRSAPVAPVCFRQNTGMLVVRQYREWAGCACAECGKRWFWKTTLHTFFLGWWGTISFVITPFLLVMNLFHGIKVMRLPSEEAAARDTLRDHEQYARNLLATKDRATVIDVLARSTGARPVDVERFVATL